MNYAPIEFSQEETQKLLGAASGEAALLYIFLKSGNALADAPEALGIHDTKLTCAAATLRQLGLWQEATKHVVAVGEAPVYTEQDVMSCLQNDASFRRLYGEVQRRLGRTLNTEELKILLAFVRYLGMPEDVICVLVSYCQDRARQRGSLRNPSLRTIEKEAYAWAEQGIDTLEAAAAFIHRQNMLRSRMAGLMRILQIHGRSLTAAEEKYARQWLDMGMDEELLAMAYERTCLNTGNLNWAYMHKILLRWHQAGYKRPEDVRKGDMKNTQPKSNDRKLDSDELAAMERMLQEGF